MSGHPIPDAALDADIAILGKKGRGKTYTAKGIVERLLKLKRRVLVLDPMSVWWGLRASADGKEPGFPIAVFGGPHGDLPLTREMGRPLARLLGRENVPAVLDMGLMVKASWQHLVGDLLEELFAVNRDPLWMVLEEADVFAPQKPMGDDSSKVLGEVDRLARRGRNFGFRLISMTQRPARLNKDVLTQLSTLVALGMTSPQDRDAISDWVKGNADLDQAKVVTDSLAHLKVGEGWVWAPDHGLLERVTFPKIATLDTSATPKAGEKRIEPKTLATVDLSEIRAALEQEARSADATGKQINAPGGKKMRGKGGGDAGFKPGYNAIVTPDPAAIAAAEARGLERGKALGIAIVYQDLGSTFSKLKDTGERLREIAADVEEIVVNFAGRQARVGVLTYKSTPAVLEETGPNDRKIEVAAPPTKPQKRLARMEDGQVARLGLIEDRAVPSNEIEKSYRGPGDMLEVLVICHPWPIEARLWGAFCGRSPISGPWHKAVRELKAAGLVESDGGRFVATAKAIAQSDPQKPAGIGSDVELWRHWRFTIAALIGDPAMGMLRVLANHRPNRLTALQWGLLCAKSPISGPWHTAVNVLKKWDCIAVDRGIFGVTEKGVAVADVEGGAPTGALLHTARAAKLSPTARKIYDALPGQRIELAKRLGMSHVSGPWHAAIKALLKSGLAGETDKVIHTIAEELG